jgi:hypothetical protein
MHLVAFITLLRESLSGMVKDSTKGSHRPVTVVFETIRSLNSVSV